MANILSLALKVTADASGLKLDPVQRALVNLGNEADKLTGVFEKFADSSEAAGAAQARVAERSQALINGLRDGTISSTQFAAQFERLTESVNAEAAAFERAARITEQNLTQFERFERQAAELREQLEAGRITQDTYNRALEGAAKGLTDAERAAAGLAARTTEIEEAAKAERDRANALAAASRIIQANLTPQERYDQQIQELRGHLEAGRLSQEQFNRAAARAQGDLDRVGQEAAKTDKNIESLSRDVRILSTIEIGRLLVDGFQLLGSTLRSVQSQVTSFVTAANASLDRLNDFSARVGIGVEDFQGYSLAAKLAGVDTEQFGTAVQRLAVNIGKATPGGELDKSLREINLSVAELRAIAPEQQFSVIGEAISQLPSAAERAAAAVEIFGKQGAALAPLFRDGAASIEELRERAQRLGVIVSEQQVNNVADMNDAFDLVSATVQGIIGQVIGNLAPAVTAVTEEFLKFVEEWSGQEGKGGTGIANAITDVLLRGAEVLAGVFDNFAGDFSGFSEGLESAAAVFEFVGNILAGVSEGLRVVFNTFERVGNLLIIGLGKILEGLGSWVDSDLEQFGRDLQATGRAAFEQNGKELTAAAENAADAIGKAFAGGEASPEASGQGAATQFLAGVRQRIEQERTPAFRVETNIDELRDRFDSFYNGIIDQSSEVTSAMREFEAVVAAAQEDAALTAEEIDRIEAAQRTVNDLMDRELQKRGELKEAARAQAEQDLQRVDGLLKASESATKVEQDILAVQREQARVAEEIAAARAAGQEEAANAAEARLAQLDQLQARLEEQQQAVEQGFTSGFDKAFADMNRGFQGLIDKAGDYGNAGALAAQQFQEFVASAQRDARERGIALDLQAIERARQIFERQIAQLEALRQKRIADEQLVFQAKVDAANRVDQFLRQGIDARVRAEQQAQAEVDNRRAQATQNVEALKERLKVEQDNLALKRAQEDVDLKQLKATQDRINALKQALQVEQQIADGKTKTQQKLQAQVLADQQSAAQQQQLLAEQAAKAEADRQQQRESVLNDITSRRQQQFERDVQRMQQLNTLGDRAVQGTDVRTQQGANLVLGLALNAQDPNLIEQRLQTKLLQRIADGIIENVVRNINAPVAIVGAARIN